MRSRRSDKRQRKLRKQQPVRRMESAASISLPRLRIPPTAQKRRRRNRRKFRLPAATLRRVLLSARWISLLLLVASALALSLIGMDENFYLTMIPVEGVASIPPSEIVAASGLAGAHIFAAEPQAAAEQIDDLPGVITATVTLEWPNRAHVRIREESPVAVWEQNGQTYWVNKAGELVPARLDTPGLVHIKVEGESPAVVQEATSVAVESATDQPGEDATGAEMDQQAKLPLLFVPQEVLQGALRLRELRPAIGDLYYDASAGLSYEDGRGWRAYFGTGTDMAQKLAVYDSLVAHLQEQEVTPAYISVSNQQTPYYLAR